MNRKHTADEYRDIIAEIKKARPDIAMSSDFIVGFPGESDQDFQDTLDVVKDVTYAFAYSFKYSPRPGTPAANMGNQIHEKVKTERIIALQELLNDQQHKFNENTVQKTLPILFDRKGSKSGQLHGRTPYNQAIHVKGNERLYGSIQDVIVTQGNANSLTGELKLID